MFCAKMLHLLLWRKLDNNVGKDRSPWKTAENRQWRFSLSPINRFYDEIFMNAQKTCLLKVSEYRLKEL